MFKVNKRNNRIRRRSNVFILTSEHNSHHFPVSIADFKQKKVYLDSFYLHSFFQTIKRCCQIHLQAILLFKIIGIGMFQEEFFVTFRV